MNMNSSNKKLLMLYRVCFLFFLFLIGVFYWRCASHHDRGGGGGKSVSSACEKGHEPIKDNHEFGSPTKVTVTGFEGHAMEPFITRDGNYLFFNGLNDGKDTCLYYASRVDDATFTFAGKIEGANGNPPHLDAVPSMDQEGRFYFISKRRYDYDHTSLFSGNFLNGAVLDLDVQPGNIYKMTSGWIVMDAEINPDGNTLYFASAHFKGANVPDKADIGMARMVNGDFNIAADSAEILKRVNTEDRLEYAPSISSDGLELFFTRVNQCTSLPEILVVKRKFLREPFGTPERIGSLSGFVEAPSISHDRKTLYFHYRDNGVYAVFKVSR
ncbi:MAG: PD40 domain-containing protein [Spirochaetes bacterium]|nr:PD40 domain-containing protein [Spirochaetota bacterium]